MVQKVTNSTQLAARRLSEIDGIRGWAAVFVLLHHLTHTPFGNYEPWMHLGGFVLLNGTFAVQLFFVLSGDALSAGFFRRQDPRMIDRMLIKRYFRLTMPILVSCFVIFLLMYFGLTFNQQAAQVFNNAALKGYLPQQPNFDEMMIYSLAQVYSHYNFHTEASFLNSLPFSYNPVFWTMAIEMKGSLMVFLALYLLPRVQNPLGLLIFLCVAFFVLFTAYAGFFFGMLLGYVRQQGRLERWLASRCWQWTSGVLLAAFIPASCWVLNGIIPKNIIALLVLCVIYTNNLSLTFFRNRVSCELGSLSFPLYAMHFAVMVSLTCWLAILAEQNQVLDGLVMSGIILVSIVASFAAAYALRAIERPYLRGLDVMADLVLGRTKQK